MIQLIIIAMLSTAAICMEGHNDNSDESYISNVANMNRDAIREHMKKYAPSGSMFQVTKLNYVWKTSLSKQQPVFIGWTEKLGDTTKSVLHYSWTTRRFVYRYFQGAHYLDYYKKNTYKGSMRIDSDIHLRPQKSREIYFNGRKYDKNVGTLGLQRVFQLRCRDQNTRDWFRYIITTCMKYSLGELTAIPNLGQIEALPNRNRSNANSTPSPRKKRKSWFGGKKRRKSAQGAKPRETVSRLSKPSVPGTESHRHRHAIGSRRNTKERMRGKTVTKPVVRLTEPGEKGYVFTETPGTKPRETVSRLSKSSVPGTESHRHGRRKSNVTRPRSTGGSLSRGEAFSVESPIEISNTPEGKLDGIYIGNSKHS